VEEVYAQSFTVDVDVFGEKKTVELKEGGKDVPLTSANRHEYIQLYVDWVLNRSVAKQFTAFKKGFDLCVPPSSLALFVPEELELLICGSEELDFGALKAATVYDDGYDEDSEVVQWFWEVLDELDDKGKKKLLMFCTGSDRVPIRGLGSMRFTISKNGPDSDLLPTSHTCFNHLLLPAYATKAKLKRYLELALENSQGFGLI
jgi:ubiquitin-protein ligase E3 A